MDPGWCKPPLHKWLHFNRPPQEVVMMLKNVKHLLSSFNCNKKIPFVSECSSNYRCRDHPSTVARTWVSVPQYRHAACTHLLGIKEEEELGIAQVEVER